MENYLDIRIDLSCFKERKSNIELITIYLFSNFENFVSNTNDFNLDKKNEIFNSFQIVMTNCKTKDGIRNLDFDYELLMALDTLASATRIEENFKKLVGLYLKTVSGKENEKLNITFFSSENQDNEKNLRDCINFKWE